MIAGILGAVTWALETLILGTAMAMAPFLSSEQAMLLAPFTSTFLHDFFSAVWACIYNGARGNLNQFFKALKSRNGRFVVLGAVIGGPLGMTGYVLSINNMGPSIGAVASAAYPAIGAALAFFLLKEKMQWYRWFLLFITLLGVYGLSYSPEITITNFWLGFAGTLMCAFGWGTEAVILAKSMQGTEVTDEIALQSVSMSASCPRCVTSEAADKMVIVMLVPVSPSGTGNTFNSLIHSFFASRFLAPAKNIFDNSLASITLLLKTFSIFLQKQIYK